MPARKKRASKRKPRPASTVGRQEGSAPDDAVLFADAKREVQRRVGRSPDTVQTWMKNGAIPWWPYPGRKGWKLVLVRDILRLHEESVGNQGARGKAGRLNAAVLSVDEFHRDIVASTGWSRATVMQKKCKGEIADYTVKTARAINAKHGQQSRGMGAHTALGDVKLETEMVKLERQRVALDKERERVFDRPRTESLVQQMARVARSGLSPIDLMACVRGALANSAVEFNPDMEERIQGALSEYCARKSEQLEAAVLELKHCADFDPHR